MEVPLLGIREIGGNPGQVSDYVTSITSGLNVLTIHRPPRKNQVFDKMETAGTVRTVEIVLNARKVTVLRILAYRKKLNRL